VPLQHSHPIQGYPPQLAHESVSDKIALPSISALRSRTGHDEGVEHLFTQFRLQRATQRCQS